MMSLDDAATYLEALGNPTRLRIYRTLVRAGGPGLSVTDLNARVGGALSTFSHHLHRLIQVELIKQQREGTTLRCHTNYKLMHEIMSFLSSECCVEAGFDTAPPGAGKTATDGEALS